MPSPVTTAAVGKAAEKIGRGAQTANAENSAGEGPHGATDVWARTWDGMGDNKDPGGKMAGTTLGASPIAAFVGRTLAGPVGGRLGGGALGLAVAAYQGVDTAKGVWAGMSGEWQSSDVGEGSRQQLGAVWDQLKTLFHAGDGQAPQGVVGHFGALVGVITEVEQLLSVLVSAVPSPALPAMRVMDVDVGLPHSHAHPPNVPGPGPIPSTGPVIPIPYVSGAATVLINGMPAARCGDMGLGVWCGGYFPFFEIFLGSSSVWLEGARAARAPTDITKHCIFSNPKSIVKGNDLPIGPPIGIPVGSSPNVLIGGIPMPSLTAMAVAAGFKGLGKVAGKVAGAAAKTKAFSRLFWAANKTKVVRKAHGVMDDMGRMRKPGQGNMDLLKDYIKARRTVKKLLDDEVIKIADNGDAAFREWVEKDLRQIASSDTGRKVLGDIAGSGKQIIIEPLDSLKVPAAEQAMGPHALKMEPARAYNGKGTGTKLRLNPDYPFTRDMPSDRALVHELGHSRNNALGQNKGMQRPPPDFDQHRWGNLEEFDNIKNVDNAYANEWKLAEREGHRHIPGMPGGGYLPPPKPAPYAPPPGVPLAGPDGSIPAPPPPKGKGHTPVMMPAAPPAPAPSPPAGGGGPPASPPPPPKGKGHTPVMMPAVPPAPPPGGSL